MLRGAGGEPVHLKHNAGIFVARKNLVTPLFFSLLLIISSTTLPVENWGFKSIENSETSSRNTVHEGDWAAYKQLPHDTTNIGCVDFAFDQNNDYIAISKCPNYYDTEITIYQNSEWNEPVYTIETDSEYYYNLDFLQFSPSGEYLIAIDDENFEIYRTSDWQRVYIGNLIEDDGSYYPATDLTWSGDDHRLVISTGNNGGKMFEGPDWAEVDGTNSNGYFVAHHPSEDILWYVSSDGAGNEYEYENIPLVGYQWVLKQNFNIDYTRAGPMFASHDGDYLLMESYYGGVYSFSSSDYSLVFSAEGYSPSLSTAGDHFIFSSNDGYKIYSTESWLMTSEIESDISYYYDFGSAFSSNDSQIITLNYDWDIMLTAWMPDDDSDGVVNVDDLCPSTPEDEGADVKGCAPSQKDTDLDGVNDRDDICPRTSTSDSANSEGCSESQLLDSDNDGISDSDDLCPATPATEYSNIFGCSKSQRDVDSDGIVDSLDNCPLYDVEDCPSVLSWVPSENPAQSTSDLVTPKWSPNGDLVATYDSDSGNVRILDSDLSIAHEIASPDIDHRLRNLYSWDSNGEWLLLFWDTGSWGSDSICGYYFWYTENQSLSDSHELSSDCSVIVGDPALNPEQTLLAFQTLSYESYTRKMIVFDFLNHTIHFEDENYIANHLMFSYDGTTLIGSSNSEIFVWDTYDGYLLRSKSIGVHDRMLLSPDSESIYIADDELIKVYSFNTLELKSTISVVGDYDSAHIWDISFSRSGELLYVPLTKRTYDDDEYFYNSTIYTYLVNAEQNLEFITKTDEINGTWYGETAYSPDEQSVIVRTFVDSGLYLWESDSDGDKIADSSDLCEHTDFNQSADENGCSWEQRDDDDDGVFNNQDLCFSTVYEMLVDEYGCSDQQVDRDLDGVCDVGAPSGGPSSCVGEDSCPFTYSGQVVDNDGCSWDERDDDDDTVKNSIDICPGTTHVETADSVGCGETQRDSDGDSVNDFWDACASTTINSTVDEQGCSDLQVDDDSDMVCNSGAQSAGPSNCTGTDFCPDTEANQTVDTNGCSWAQQDDDFDGVLNPNDSCPGTSQPDVSPDGCSSWQRDSDNDGVVDFLDECAKTPEDEFSNQVGCSESQVQSSAETGDSSGVTSIQWFAFGGILLVALLLGGFMVMRRKPLTSTSTQTEIIMPEYQTRGAMKSDGKEWIEFPSGSGYLFYRDQSSGQWVKHE